MLKRLKIICTELTKKWECELVEFNGEADHLHLLLSLNPKVTKAKGRAYGRSTEARFGKVIICPLKETTQKRVE
jgi:REP element-mobilizing transposase RayT